MPALEDVKQILDSVLNLNGRAGNFDFDTILFGGIPELDSMAIVNVITALEEHFGVVFDDEEITAETFETVGSLTLVVEEKL